MFDLNLENISKRLLKGGLSARMTWLSTLGSDDLIIFKCFSVVLSLKKRKLSNFRFRSIFIFNKKEAQSCLFATYRRNALFVFLTSETGEIAFPIFKVIMKMHLFNSLAKSCTIFWKYSSTINRNDIFELTYHE